MCVLGASGAIGQNLSLLLKQSRLITELALYDLDTASTPIAGVAADVSHINTPAKVTAYAGFDSLEKCVRDAHLAIITAGVARKPGASHYFTLTFPAALHIDLYLYILISILSGRNEFHLTRLMHSRFSTLMRLVCKLIQRCFTFMKGLY